MAACAENLTPVLLELGGKDATVVAEDADLEAAAEAVVWGGNWHAGQGCVVRRAGLRRRRRAGRVPAAGQGQGRGDHASGWTTSSTTGR